MRPLGAIARRYSKVALARASVIATLAGACALALATVAMADQPTKTTTTQSDTFDVPAGELCDFNYTQSFTLTDTQIVLSDGTEIHHLVELVTHENADTGYALTERDQINLTFYPDGTPRQVGIAWHLRDPSGKLVVEEAGQLIFDDMGNLVKFTPHITPSFAAVICPALGGNPA
jgi:hypothetical protein